MTTTFESAYKALEDAKSAAKVAAVEGVRTGNAEIINLAGAQLSTATTEFREMLKRETVDIPEKGLILKVEFACLEKLAKDNGCDLQKVIGGVEAVSNGRISSLNLHSLGLKDISALAQLTGLTKLLLFNNKISDIAALSRLTALTMLNLGYNKISNITALAGLTALTDLSLHNNKISDIKIIAKLTNLAELYLSENHISDINAIAGLTALRKLSLYSSSFINRIKRFINWAALKQDLRILRSRNCEIYGVVA